MVRTVLPARGIANGLLRGRSNGPFTMAVVAAEQFAGIGSVCDLRAGRLAPGGFTSIGSVRFSLSSLVAGVAGRCLRSRDQS